MADIKLHKFDLDKIPEQINNAKIIGVDTEMRGLDVHRDPLCLVQISSGNNDCHIIQLDRENYQAPKLLSILEDNKIKKIFHYARADLGFLKNYLNANIENIECTKIKSKLSDVTYSMGPHEVLKLLLKSFGIYRGEISGDCLQIPIYRYGIKIVTRRFVDFCKRENIKISVWTINSIEEMDYLIDLDVDGIITDKPKALINLLASKNT